MELTDFETRLVEAWRAYDNENDFQAQGEKIGGIVDVLATRLNQDGWDSVWYARACDRVNSVASYSSFRAADDVSFYGLARLVSRWAESTNPPVVAVDNE